MDYFAFSPEYFYAAISLLLSNIGLIFSVILYLLLLILGIYAAVQIIGELIQ